MAIRDARYERSELDPLRRRSEEGQRQPAFEDRVIPLPQLDEVVPDPDRIEPCLLGASSDCGEVLSHSGIPARPFEVVDLETEFHARRLLGCTSGERTGARGGPSWASESPALYRCPCNYSQSSRTDESFRPDRRGTARRPD